MTTSNSSASGMNTYRKTRSIRRPDGSVTVMNLGALKDARTSGGWDVRRVNWGQDGVDYVVTPKCWPWARNQSGAGTLPYKEGRLAYLGFTEVS